MAFRRTFKRPMATRRTGGYKKPYVKRARTSSYRQKTNTETVSVKAHMYSQKTSVEMNGAYHIAGCATVSDVTTCPIFQRYSGLYQKVRLSGISVKIVNCDSQSNTVLTFVDTGDELPPSTIGQCLNQPSLMNQTMSSDRAVFRSMKFIGNNLYSEWQKTSTTDSIAWQSESLKAAIKFWVQNTGGLDKKVEIYTTYQLQFCSLHDPLF
jgi:hypothetical protein